MDYIVRVDRKGTERRVGHALWERVGTDDDGKPTFGWTPEIERLVDVDEKVFEQRITDLDVRALAAFLNAAD